MANTAKWDVVLSGRSISLFAPLRDEFVVFRAGSGITRIVTSGSSDVREAKNKNYLNGKKNHNYPLKIFAGGTLT